jgi:hypothetical protein
MIEMIGYEIYLKNEDIWCFLPSLSCDEPFEYMNQN